MKKMKCYDCSHLKETKQGSEDLFYCERTADGMPVNGDGLCKMHSKRNCYIATAVYGTYEAPQVITLRRFRDEVLDTSYLGRLLVKIYYRFSPPVAERLKSAKRVNMVVRKVLNKIVERLEK